MSVFGKIRRKISDNNIKIGRAAVVVVVVVVVARVAVIDFFSSMTRQS